MWSIVSNVVIDFLASVAPCLSHSASAGNVLLVAARMENTERTSTVRFFKIIVIKVASRFVTVTAAAAT
jgi:hypothetical protein